MSASPAPSPLQQPDPWDAVAPTYAEDSWRWASYSHEALRRLPVGPDDRVLDLACGPGTLTFELSKHAAQVDAVDFSPGMIERLGARASQLGASNIKAAVMDAQALEFPDRSFDAAFSMFAFFFFPNRARAFAELLRVLRPDGRALIATWAPIERRPVMAIGFEAMAEALPHLPRPGKGDLQDPAECVREMSAAGFRDVSATPFTASVKIDSPEHYLDLIVRSGAPFAMMKKKLDAASWSDTLERLLASVRRRIPAGGTELTAEAIYTIGMR